MKRAFGILLAGIAIAAGMWFSRSIDQEARTAIRADAQKAAILAQQRATDGLTVFHTDLKLKAANAAANPRLIFALQGNVDEATLRDLWRTEDWWRPWRDEFKVYAISRTGTKLDVAEGIDRGDMEAAAILRRVRERRQAVSEIVLGKGWPYAAAATPTDSPGHVNLSSAILFLAKPLDGSVLQGLAEKTGGALALSDGKRFLMAAGPERDQLRLQRAIGTEGIAATFAPPASESAVDEVWAASASPLVPGQWLWAYAAINVATHGATSAAFARKVMTWAGALLVAALALFYGFRPKRNATAGGPFDPITGRPTSPTNSTTTASLSAAAPAGGPTGTQVLSASQVTVTSPVTATPAAADQTSAATLINTGGAKVFGRYTLLDRLGEGGMAEVYTAVTFGAEGFRRRFVIKRLRAEFLREPRVLAQFIDEANLASSMVHSNIVPVFDFGRLGDEFYMAQEYILGRDLSRVVGRIAEQNLPPLSIASVLFVAQEVLKALEYAHTKTNENGQPMGIVHRDVSPSNIIVSARGEVKLFDFGIVKAEGRVTRTEAGVVKGNVLFMSPEQAQGIAVDGRSDLFSLGLVMFDALTGSPLYAGSTTYELLVKAAVGPDAEAQARIRALPHPCNALLSRVLRTAPAERFASAAEFLAAVRPFVAGGALDLTATVDDLFAADFRAEEARFLAALPPSSPSGSAPPSPIPSSSSAAAASPSSSSQTGPNVTPRPNRG